MTLDELAIKHGTDKSSEHHDYCKVYERYFESFRDIYITFLELGYGNGGSVRMWKEYAPLWHINVLDNATKEDIPSGVNFIHTGQADVRLLSRWFYAAPLDVIIDDASHQSGLTIRSFEILFPFLKSGGYYCIEDTHSSITPAYYGKGDANENPRKNGKMSVTALNYFKNLTDACNNDILKEKYRLPFEVEFVHFFRDLIIIKKL